MHFCYLDEAGCTGENLEDTEQRVFVMGGVCVSDEKWNKTREDVSEVIKDFYGGTIPAGYEIHTADLLSLKGGKEYGEHALERRWKLVSDLLDVICERKHAIHFLALKKEALRDVVIPNGDYLYNPKTPFLLTYDYMITYLNETIRTRLGKSATGMIIMDNKEQYKRQIKDISLYRRFGTPKTHRANRVVEFSYTVDSKENRLIQISDLISFCTKRFFEIELGYHDAYPKGVKRVYASFFDRIYSRVTSKRIIPRGDKPYNQLDTVLAQIQLKPSQGWRETYGIDTEK